MFKSKTTMLLVGLAGAYAAYRYLNMSESEKDAFKSKARKFIEKNLPEEVKNLFGSTEETNEDGKERSFS